MGWNRKQKRRLLAVVVLFAAGCTSTNYRAGRRDLAKSPRVLPSPANVPDQAPPQILPATFFAAGRMFEAQGQFGKAMNQYRRAIAAGHNHAAAYHHLGLILSKLQQHDEAIAMLSRAVELKPRDAVARNNLGFELMFDHRWDDAGKQLSKAIELQPQFARAHINLGMTLSKVGRFDEALEHFRTVLPEQDAQYNLGLMYRASKQYAAAAGAFHRALDRDPKFRAAQTQLADIAPHLSPKTEGKPAAETPVLAATSVKEPIAVAEVPAPAPVPTPAPSPQIVPVSSTRTQVVAKASEPFREPKPVAFVAPVQAQSVDAARTAHDAVAATDDFAEPCQQVDQVTAMIADGTLPPAPVNMVRDDPVPLDAERYDEKLESRANHAVSVALGSYEKAESDEDPCDAETVDAVVDGVIDVIDAADPVNQVVAEKQGVAALNPTISPESVQITAAQRPDPAEQMPLGDLNDEVARIEDEINCLVEEALDAIAENAATAHWPQASEPIATPHVDEAVARRVTQQIDTHTVHAQTQPQAMPLSDWHQRMEDFEQQYAALRAESNCLEQLDDDLTTERLATAVEPAAPPMPVIVPVVDTPKTSKHAPHKRYTKFARASKMTTAYHLVEPKVVLTAPMPRASEHKRIPAIRTTTTSRPTNAIATFVDSVSDEDAIFGPVPVDPVLLANYTDSAGWLPVTNEFADTEVPFDWGRQFGDLEDLASITHNEIRCWDDMDQSDQAQGEQTQNDRDRVTSTNDMKRGTRKTKVTPVRYNGRRNPFYKK